MNVTTPGIENRVLSGNNSAPSEQPIPVENKIQTTAEDGDYRASQNLRTFSNISSTTKPSIKDITNAVENNNIALVKQYIVNGVPLNVVDERGSNLLCLAIHTDLLRNSKIFAYIPIIKLLIENGVHINTIDKHGNSFSNILHSESLSERQQTSEFADLYAIVQEKLKKADSISNTVANEAIIAIKNNDIEKLGSLLKDNPDLALKKNCEYKTHKVSLLIIATLFQNTAAIELLKNHDADFNFTTPIKHSTALHIECNKKSPDINTILLLIRHGTFIDKINKREETIIDILIKKNHMEIVEKLFQYYCSLNCNCLTKRMITMSHSIGEMVARSNKVVKYILSSNPNLEKIQTILYDCPKIVKLKSIKYTSPQGTEKQASLLFIAAFQYSRLSQDNNPAIINRRKTVFEIFKLISSLSSHHEINFKTARTSTSILTLVVDSRDQNLVEYILNKGANPNVADSCMGYTPLHIASVNGDTEIVDLLLKHGANINAATKTGETALDLVNGNNLKYYTMIQHLTKHGCKALKDRIPAQI